MNLNHCVLPLAEHGRAHKVELWIDFSFFFPSLIAPCVTVKVKAGWHLPTSSLKSSSVSQMERPQHVSEILPGYEASHSVSVTVSLLSSFTEYLSFTAT